jgi:hypothetical protein
MKRFQTMCVALFALLALGMLTVTAASAQVTFLLAEWFVSGLKVTTELLTEVTGELELADTVLKATVLCSGSLDGWVGPISLGFISEVLSLGGAEIGQEVLKTPPLLCRSVESCSGAAPEVWAINLGWETEVELLEETGFTGFAVFITSHAGGGVPGWVIQCTILGVKAEDECTVTRGVAQLTLEGVALLANLSDAFTELAELKLFDCSIGGVESGVVTGGGVFAVSGGGELTALSDGAVS